MSMTMLPKLVEHYLNRNDLPVSEQERQKRLNQYWDLVDVLYSGCTPPRKDTDQ